MDTRQPLLRFKSVDAYYGPHHVLQGVDYEIFPGEIVCLLGGNASGKSTTMKCVLGIVQPKRGSIEFKGERIDKWDTGDRVRAGIAPVPEARRVFPDMTVMENLELGAFARRDRGKLGDDYQRVFDLFPRLAERRKQLAGTMSGGEQQMLAIGRALMSQPRLLLLDEPSLGLAPIIIQQIFDTIEQLREQGMTIFLVEQNANQALKLADRGYVLENGHVVLEDTGDALLANEAVRSAYLGG